VLIADPAIRLKKRGDCVLLMRGLKAARRTFLDSLAGLLRLFDFAPDGVVLHSQERAQAQHLSVGVVDFIQMLLERRLPTLRE